MREALMTLMGMTVLSGIAGMLIPEGSMGRGVRFAGALCFLLVMVSPLKGLIGEWEKGEDWIGEILGNSPEIESIDYDEIYNQSLLNGGLDFAEKTVESQLITAFSLPEGSLTVDLEMATENGKREIKTMEVTLGHLAIFADPREIVAFVNETWQCSCVVVYD